MLTLNKIFSLGGARFHINIEELQTQENADNAGHPLYGAPLYPMYTSGRPPWGGRARASFVECGLILMGTDDKQRKQASSLPGEICLLLAGVQRGPDTRASRTPTRDTSANGRKPRRAIGSYRHSWLPLQPGRRRARNSRKGRGRGARASRRTQGTARPIVYAHHIRTCPRGYVSRRVASRRLASV